MAKKTSSTKKLTVRKEKLRELSEAALGQPAGGYYRTSYNRSHYCTRGEEN